MSDASSTLSGTTPAPTSSASASTRQRAPPLCLTAMAPAVSEPTGLEFLWLAPRGTAGRGRSARRRSPYRHWGRKCSRENTEGRPAAATDARATGIPAPILSYFPGRALAGEGRGDLRHRADGLPRLLHRARHRHRVGAGRPARPSAAQAGPPP